jgi:hypothetical protein
VSCNHIILLTCCIKKTYATHARGTHLIVVIAVQVSDASSKGVNFFKQLAGTQLAPEISVLLAQLQIPSKRQLYRQQAVAGPPAKHILFEPHQNVLAQQEIVCLPDDVPQIANFAR